VGFGGWYFRYDAPALSGQIRRRPEFGPFETKKRAEEELTAELARVGGGAPVADRSVLVRDYLDTWLAGKKLRLKRDTYTSYVEACELYFKPGVGHLRLVELRDRHLQDLVTAMTQINQPMSSDEKPSEMLRRLIAVRADDTPQDAPRRRDPAQEIHQAVVARADRARVRGDPRRAQRRDPVQAPNGTGSSSACA
jgi:hypothetical protein